MLFACLQSSVTKKKQQHMKKGELYCRWGMSHRGNGQMGDRKPTEGTTVELLYCTVGGWFCLNVSVVLMGVGSCLEVEHASFKLSYCRHHTGNAYSTSVPICIYSFLKFLLGSRVYAYFSMKAFCPHQLHHRPGGSSKLLISSTEGSKPSGQSNLLLILVSPEMPWKPSDSHQGNQIWCHLLWGYNMTVTFICNEMKDKSSLVPLTFLTVLPLQSHLLIYCFQR